MLQHQPPTKHAGRKTAPATNHNRDNNPTKKIATSYGHSATVNGLPTGFIYGGGYGRDKKLSREADRAAILLVKAFGLPVEKRGNSDGLSCGAHHDGDYSFAIGARTCKLKKVKEVYNELGIKSDDEQCRWFTDKEGDTIRYEAYFYAMPGQIGEIIDGKFGKELNLNPAIPGSTIWCQRADATLEDSPCMVASPTFPTMHKALAWLKKYGGKYCPAISDISAPPAVARQKSR